MITNYKTKTKQKNKKMKTPFSGPSKVSHESGKFCSLSHYFTILVSLRMHTSDLYMPGEDSTAELCPQPHVTLWVTLT